MTTEEALQYVRSGTATPPALNTEDDKKFNWEDIAAGGYSAINSALFGIPDVLVKVASSDAYKNLQALRERNKAASLVGDIAGAFAPTGGLLAKGIGTGAKLVGRGLQAAKLAKGAATAAKVAKVADTAGDIIKGTKAVKGLGGAVGRGALATAEATLPRLVTGEIDLGEAAQGAALGGAVGAAGYGLGKAIGRIPELFAEAQNWANKTILKRADITNKVMRAQEQFAGGDVKKYVKELADLADEFELHREPKLDELVDNVKKTWRDMAEKFDASGFTTDAQKVIDTEDVAQAIKRNVGTMDAVNDIVTKTEATEGFGNKRKYLQEIIFGDKTGEDEKKIARAILGQIEEEAEKLSGLDVGKAKEQWRMMKPFEMADKLEDMRISGAGTVRGSDTAFKLALGGVGAAVGGGSQVKGVIDDPSNPDAWSKLITASLGGSLAGAANKQIGITLAKAIRKLPADKIAEFAEKIANGKVAEVLAKLPKTEALTSVAGKLISERLADEPIATPVGEEPVSADSPEGQALQEKEQQFGEEYITRLGQKMVEYWALNFADTMTYEEYVKKVGEMTGNFDPRKTASFFYRDKKERSNFLRDLDVAETLKGKDISSTFAKPGLFSSILEPAQSAQQKMDQATVIDTIAKLVTDEGNLPSKATKETIQADISAILDLEATPEEKQQLLFQKLEEKYGMNYTSLKELGLA